jgi:hypothetical protein
MEHGIDGLEGALNRRRVPNVPGVKFHFPIQVGRFASSRPMHLRRKRVEGPYLVTMFQKFVCQVGSDEARTTCNENFPESRPTFVHVI